MTIAFDDSEITHVSINLSHYKIIPKFKLIVKNAPSLPRFLSTYNNMDNICTTCMMRIIFTLLKYDSLFKYHPQLSKMFYYVTESGFYKNYNSKDLRKLTMLVISIFWRNLIIINFLSNVYITLVTQVCTPDTTGYCEEQP